MQASNITANATVTAVVDNGVGQANRTFEIVFVPSAVVIPPPSKARLFREDLICQNKDLKDPKYLLFRSHFVIYSVKMGSLYYFVQGKGLVYRKIRI